MAGQRSVAGQTTALTLRLAAEASTLHLAPEGWTAHGGASDGLASKALARDPAKRRQTRSTLSKPLTKPLSTPLSSETCIPKGISES